MQLDPAHNRPMTDAEQFGFGGARKLVQRITESAQAVQSGAQLLTDPAKLSTLAEHTREREPVTPPMQPSPRRETRTRPRRPQPTSLRAQPRAPDRSCTTSESCLAANRLR